MGDLIVIVIVVDEFCQAENYPLYHSISNSKVVYP